MTKPAPTPIDPARLVDLALAVVRADRFPDMPARDLVRMATWEGARALGRLDLGRIAVGSRPGLVAIETGAPVESDPCAFVVANVRALRRWVVRRRGAER